MTDCLLNPKPNSKQMDITDAWYIWTVSSSLAWSWHALLLNTSLRWLLELIKLSCLPYSSMFKTIDFIHAHYVVCNETFQPRKSDIFVILLSFSFFLRSLRLTDSGFDFAALFCTLLTSNCCIHKKATRTLCIRL